MLTTLQSYQSPTGLVQGLGAIRELGREAETLGVKRPLVVTDRGIAAVGLLVPALQPRRAAGLDPVSFDRVQANPGIELVDSGVELYLDSACDGLVAIGGGSSIDTAKGIGVAAVHGGSIASYEWGRGESHSRVPPLVAVPTPAGTGSEVTLWAVRTDPDRKAKFK